MILGMSMLGLVVPHWQRWFVTPLKKIYASLVFTMAVGYVVPVRVRGWLGLASVIRAVTLLVGMIAGNVMELVLSPWRVKMGTRAKAVKAERTQSNRKAVKMKAKRKAKALKTIRSESVEVANKERKRK